MSTDREPEAESRLAVALDFPSAHQALACIDRLEGCCRWMKVGMELFYAAGIPLIESLLARDLKVFLDLKLHDIPNTVAGAVRSAAASGAHMLTLHASGGEAMMRAAAEAAGKTSHAPRLLAVTVLTSMDRTQLHEVGVDAEPAHQVLRLARLAASCGINGLVCSAEETSLLRRSLVPDTFLVVPGIRAAGADTGDQRRVASASEAIACGASMLVIGRPITRAPDPAAAVRALLAEIAAATHVAPALSENGISH